MSNAQRLIPFAFGTVVVLLAANLPAGTRNAGSEIGVRGPAAMPIGITSMSVVNTAPNNDLRTVKAYVFRLWSDGTVDVNDANDVVFVPGDPEQDFSGWLPLDDTPVGDLNADGCVDAFDLSILLAEWCSVAGGNPCGTCFPPP